MLDLNFTPFPNLSTERMDLKRITNSDINEVFAIRSNPKLMKYVPRPVAKNTEDAQLVINRINDGIDSNETLNWGMYLKTSSKLIGIIGYVRFMKDNYRGEFGYILHQDYHGQGLIHEAVQAVVEYGFKGLKLHTVEALINPENTASIKVVERSGFEKEGRMREFIFHNNQFHDCFIYAKVNPF